MERRNKKHSVLRDDYGWMCSVHTKTMASWFHELHNPYIEVVTFEILAVAVTSDLLCCIDHQSVTLGPELQRMRVAR